MSLILMLGTVLNNRAPILGIALGSILGGTLLGGLIQPLLYVTPWMLGKFASLGAGSEPVPAGLLWAPVSATEIWSSIFLLVALVKFEKDYPWDDPALQVEWQTELDVLVSALRAGDRAQTVALVRKFLAVRMSRRAFAGLSPELIS